MASAIKELNLIIINLVNGFGSRIVQKLAGESEGIRRPLEGFIETRNLRHGNITAKILHFNKNLAYQLAHRIFLTDQTICIIITELDADNNLRENIDFWKQEIRNYSKCHIAVVIIDKNMIEPTSALLPYETIGFPGVSYHRISETDPTDLVNLRQFLLEIINHHIVPLASSRKWKKVKTDIKDDKRDYILVKEFKNICTIEGIHDEDETKSLLLWLHKFGYVITFFDDLRLQNVIILNPQWITSAVNSINTSNAIFTNHAILEMSMIEKYQILTGYQNTQEKLLIVDMMMKFGLCIEVESNDNKKKYLITNLIDKHERHVGNWENPRIELKYEYETYPTHIIPNITAKLYPYVVKNTYWLDGCLLCYGTLEEASALIKFFPETNSVQVLIKGTNPETCMKFRVLIQETIQKVNNSLRFSASLHVIKDEFNNENDFKKKWLKTISLKIINFFFIAIPRYIGAAILVAFGRKNSDKIVSVIIGYIIIVIIALILNGNITIEMLKETWRFFFPEPK